MFLPEYGRHIHEMIDYLSTIDDREQRNQQTRAVIAVMANINPMLRDSADFDQKLWDHLFIMSDFQLDIDSPFPVPSREALSPVPRPLAYPAKHIARKHYGKHIEKMLRALREVDDKPGVECVLANIARYLRTKSYEYNQEHPNNELIIRDIRAMSGGAIELDEDALNNIKSEYKQPSHYQNRVKKGAPQNRNPKNNKNAKNNGAKQRYVRPK